MTTNKAKVRKPVLHGVDCYINGICYHGGDVNEFIDNVDNGVISRHEVMMSLNWYKDPKIKK